MMQCNTSVDSVPGVATARVWLDGVAIVSLYGIILVSLCKNMHEVSGSVLPKLVIIGHSVYWGLLVLLQIISLSLISAVYNFGFDVSRNMRKSADDMKKLKALNDASKGMVTTYDVFALLGMGIAAASMLFAVLRSSQLKKGVSRIQQTAVIRNCHVRRP